MVEGGTMDIEIRVRFPPMSMSWLYSVLSILRLLNERVVTFVVKSIGSSYIVIIIYFRFLYCIV